MAAPGRGVPRPLPAASQPDADLSSDPLRDDFLRDIVVEIDDLVDMDGKDVPCV